MPSLFSKTSVLLALFWISLQTAVALLTNSSSLAGEDDGPPTSEVTCDYFASCAPGIDHKNQCFCDRLCRIYGDCCSDYVDEEDGYPPTPLPAQHFTCTRISSYPYSVYVITDCPSTYDVRFVLDGCRHGSASARPPSTETFYVVPVTSRTSRLVYRNIYCAVCHGEEDAGFWNVTTVCQEPSTEDTVSSGQESSGIDDIDTLMRQESFVDDCSFSFTPTIDVPEPRRCVDSIATCPDDADAELVSGCLRSSNVVYVYASENVPYRNRDCSACNGEAGNLSCFVASSATPITDHYHYDYYYYGDSDLESFAIILDLNVGKGSAVGLSTGGSRTQRLGSCPDGHVYDPFAGTCRSVTCPPGTSLTEIGQCNRPQPRNSADDEDCAWIRLDWSEYQLLSNRSIYVLLHNRTYDNDSYKLGDNHTVQLCTPFQRNYTKWVNEALILDEVGTYVSIVCSVISLLALAFQFAVYMVFPVLRNTPGRCIICLVASLFVGQLLFLLVKTGSSVSSWFCFGQAVTMHYAFTAAFFWMNVIAFDVYRTFAANPAAAASSSPSGARRRFARYSAYAWMSAATAVIVGVAMDLTEVGGAYRPLYGRRLCWFGNRGGILLLFGVPVGVLLAANIVMFALSVRHIRSASKASQMALQRTDQTQLLVSFHSHVTMSGLRQSF